MSSLVRGFLAAATLAVLALSMLAAAVPAAAQAEKGPATDRVIWRAITLEQVKAALEAGEIDVYVYGLRPSAAQELAGTPGIKLYQAPSGLVDIGLNPAPVLIVKLQGELSKEEAAARLGIDPVAIGYIKAANGTTTVELCAKPLGGLPSGVEVVYQSDEYDINPFCFREIRFALNYVIDRDYIVKNIYRGFAIPKYTFYGPDDPTYTVLIDIVAKYKFTYNPQLAKQIIGDVLTRVGAEQRGGTWYYNGKPITVIGIIRVEDERLDIGNLFADELEKTIGFRVQRLQMTFGEAITRVYATCPEEFQWFFYTEGWGKGALDKWDPWNLAQFAAPWYGWSPGWGDPSCWNYKNETIDFYSKATALGEVTSKEQWIEYMRKGTELGLQESIRLWIAATLSTTPAREELRGVTLDLGAGLRNPFMYRGMYMPGSDTVKVGHRWVFTARTVYNVFGGFDDVYSVDPMRATWDPFIWRHPFSGAPIPFRVTFEVETAGPEGKLNVPSDAIWWDAENDRWVYVSELGRSEATSKVVFDLSKVIGTKWHHGVEITWADVLAYWAELLDITYDPVKSQIEAAIAAPSKETFDKFVAIRPLLDENKLEVYVNYWHFDPSYIADFAVVSIYNPAELIFAQDYLAFTAKTYALDETRAEKENIPQLNLVLPEHASDVAASLQQISLSDYAGYVTLPDGTQLLTESEFAERIQAVQSWVDQYGIAWISDGPFKLVRFDKDAQELELEAFRDPSYPFGPTDWVFGEPTPTTITGIAAPLIEPGRPSTIVVTVSGLPPIHVVYILRDPATGQVIATGEASQTPTGYAIELGSDITSQLEEYAAYELSVIAYSEQVALPAERTVILQTTAAVTGAISSLEQSVSQLQTALEQLQQQVGGQVAEALEPVANVLQQLGNTVQQVGSTVGQLQTDVNEVKSTVGDLSSKLEQLTSTVEG
ncbi:MAG: ABC transporter substrate-binding protein, partial [Thermoproteota archaeon]